MSAQEAKKRLKHLEAVDSESLSVKLSGDLLERVEMIADEMDVAPEEVIRLSVQRVVGGMAPELEAELRRYISTIGMAGAARNFDPGVIEKHYRRGPKGGGEIIV